MLIKLKIPLGLQSLIEIYSKEEKYNNTNVVVKSSLKVHSNTIEHCYLNACHLCHKLLTLDKEVYMYRGDQGYCSKECRERQIKIDEIQEMETSRCYYNKQALKSYKLETRYHCNSVAGRSETNKILRDLLRRHGPPNSLPHQKIKWDIVS